MIDTVICSEDECGTGCRVIAVSASFVGAWLVYGLSRFFWLRQSKVYRDLSPGERAAWDTRTVSTVHSMLTGVWAIVCLVSATYYMPHWSVGQPTGTLSIDTSIVENGPPGAAAREFDAFFFGGNFQMEMLLCVSLGYFLQDSLVIVGVRGELWKLEDIIHHGTILFNLSTALLARTFLPYITWAYLAEMSTPLHNIRYYLERIGLQSLALDLVFVVTFLLVRPISFTWLIMHMAQHYEAWSHSLPALFIVSIALLFFALNYYWTSLVVRGVVNALRPSAKPKEA